MVLCLAKVVSQFEQIGHDSLYSESCNCIGDKKEGQAEKFYFFEFAEEPKIQPIKQGSKYRDIGLWNFREFS